MYCQAAKQFSKYFIYEFIRGILNTNISVAVQRLMSTMRARQTL